ncbi:MAG: hypothetical protein QOD56_3260 [Gammaproteobacteria bacterium]|nr:hypothetical protein [Gammaproteobacteria bacterium]
MDSSLFKMAVITVVLAGCANRASIKPAEVLDERTGVTVGALQEPLEFVVNSQNAALSNARRATFAYLGPIEWDRMGEISYAVWVHVAPGNDRQVGDIRAQGAVTLNLDDGPMVLSAVESPGAGRGPYKPVVSWGQTAYFALTVDMLKRMAGSQKLILDLRAVDDSTLNFIPSQDTRSTLTQFTRARGITDD